MDKVDLREIKYLAQVHITMHSREIFDLGFSSLKMHEIICYVMKIYIGYVHVLLDTIISKFSSLLALAHYLPYLSKQGKKWGW